MWEVAWIVVWWGFRSTCGGRLRLLVFFLLGCTWEGCCFSERLMDNWAKELEGFKLVVDVYELFGF